MKPPLHLVAALITLTLTPAFGQPQPATAPGVPPVERTPEPIRSLTKFNLNFPGGTPKQLVAAVEKAMGKTINVIIPDECADLQIPPLKMNNVDVPQLFQAMAQAGQQSLMPFVIVGEGKKDDGAVWTFIAHHRPSPPKVCRFYSLAPYIERGQSVDDITTAIQTGWKMLGDKNTPAINFHKDTKLLIAVGEPDKLEIIDAVLNSLKPPPGAKPPEKPKAEK